jgi:uncharacterized protein
MSKIDWLMPDQLITPFLATDIRSHTARAAPSLVRSLQSRESHVCICGGSCAFCLSAVLSLTVAFFLGSGWYLAGKIRSEALRVNPGDAIPDYDDVEVVGLFRGQIQLRSMGDQPALFKPELYGIAWDGGIGRLAASVTVSSGVVTRPLTVMYGSAPRIGHPAALGRSYFLGDPEAELGIPLQEVVVQGPLSPLPAWYFPGRSSTFVIGVHGQNGHREDVLRVVDIVHHMGFPALAVTYRNDRGTAPDPSGYLRHGQTEWGDIEAAVRWALACGARRIILVGQSMGGGIVAAFLKQSPLAPKVARVVLDAPMLDLHATVDNQVDRHRLPIIGRIPSRLICTGSASWCYVAGCLNVCMSA